MAAILDLPDDVLVEFCSRYLSAPDLCRLGRVCRRFQAILQCYPSSWRKALARLTNVSFSQLKNAAGCPAVTGARAHPPTINHPFHVPDSYEYDVLLDRSSHFPRLLPPEDHRRAYRCFNRCPKQDCDINRLVDNHGALLPLAFHWNTSNYTNSTLVKFTRRPQTSLIQYDEHQHQLWFSQDRTLRCLNLGTSHLDHSYAFDDDDVLCYKVYDDHLICVANGNVLRIISRDTNHIHSYPTAWHLQQSPGERNDILSLDIYSNDQERYAILNGSRDHTVSMQTFDLSKRVHQVMWRTQVDDRVLCSRFTSDGQYFLIGTGGTSNVYPLALFHSERAQPVHVYNAQYRRGAGVRCIEWVSSNVFIAAGFDGQFKEFDLRTGQCHYTFSDDFGNDYCSLAVSVDHADSSNGIILGSNHHSTVRLVNRKQRQLQKVFFVTQQASPVHSLAVTPEYLFASVDRSIVALDFTGCKRKFQQIKLHY